MIRMPVRGKAATLSVLLVCLCALNIAWVSPPLPLNALPARPLPDAAGSPGDNIIVATIVPSQVYFGQSFMIKIFVNNFGSVPLQNVHLHCKVNPGNSFVISGVDQPFIVADANNVNIALDDLLPGAQKELNITVEVPALSRITTDRTRTYCMEFTKSCSWSPETYAGSVNISAGHGKLLVETAGFE
jgi:hypothetical protein